MLIMPPLEETVNAILSDLRLARNIPRLNDKWAQGPGPVLPLGSALLYITILVPDMDSLEPKDPSVELCVCPDDDEGKASGHNLECIDSEICSMIGFKEVLIANLREELDHIYSMRE